MKNAYLAIGLLIMCFLTACVKEPSSDYNLNAWDSTFLKKTAIGNTAEIQAGMLAAQKGTSLEIRGFGEAMVAEHTQAQNDLKKVGESVHFPIADTVDAEHLELMMLLNSLSGREFDSAYIHSQVVDHRKTKTLFEEELSYGKNRNVVDYANIYAPHIQVHLTTAESIASKY
jgi:putative membrane protein